MSEHPQTIGRYRIVRLLGSGAMGDVYLAEDPNIDRELAIKTVRVMGGSPEDVEDRKQRLLREARAAGKFVHPNVVTLFDADEVDGQLYLAFEYVPPGIDLAKRMTSSPQVTLRQALRWVREIAQALHYAHERGIVHRDIKPSNVLIAADGTAKVADFGIAKLLGPGTELTRTGSVVGSPQYMSPEQVRGETLDGRSDVFSLGVVFYELLCGIRPFGGETLSTLVFEILSKEPPPVGSLRPSLPGELVALAHRMLAKDRNHRSATAEAVVQDIRKLEASIPVHQLDDTAAPSDVEETRRIATAISQQIDSSAQIHQGAGSEAPTRASDAMSTPGFVPPPPPVGSGGAPSDPTLAASQHPPAAPVQASAPTPMSTQLPARGVAASASSGSKTARNVVLGLGVLGAVGIAGLVGLWFILRSFAPQLLPAALGGSGPADFMEIETAELAPPDDTTEDPAAGAAVPDEPAAPAAAVAAPPVAPAASGDEPPDETGSEAAAVEAIRDEVKQARSEPEPAPPPPTREQTTPPPPPPPVRRADPEPVRSAPPPAPPQTQAQTDPEPKREPEPEVDRDLRRWQAAASRANREMSTGLRFRFDIKPKDLLAIVRVWPEGEDIIVKGQAEDFKDGRKGKDMTLPGDGDHLVQLLIGGEVQHSILVHASAGNPQATTVSLDLR